ncbi:hypothetical protein AVEN_264821-1 [Araneus ventricosus]|uniref:Uncharacterized protein n=1 Tax=Araneus ventricosus TaxID=182803 RepID=A0A4Y2DZC4_ARAVE|nr:hypothetical protein AVEN_264821-1 [Araneus ventricosus]
MDGLKNGTVWSATTPFAWSATTPFARSGGIVNGGLVWISTHSVPDIHLSASLCALFLSLDVKRKPRHLSPATEAAQNEERFDSFRDCREGLQTAV